MKLKHKISLIVIGLLLVVSLFISTSYALWSFNVSQESTNVVLSDCFEITFADTHPISLEYAFPMEDSLGVQLTPYEFSISNVCNHPADFQINLETLNNSTLDSSNIKADLNGFITSVESAESIEPTISNASSAVMLKEDTLAVNETKTYNLRLWVKEDAVSEEVENKSYASKVSIKAVVRKKFDVAMLKRGVDFNSILKSLAHNELVSVYSNDSSITSIERSFIAPQESDNAVLVSDSGSAKPIYAWFDNGTIYIYSDVDKIFMNKESSHLFYALTNLTSLDLSYFDTSNVENMSFIFSETRSLTSLDLSNFDTSKVTNMTNMFSGTGSLTTLDLSNIDTSKVTNMSRMFYASSTLKELNLSNFDTSNVESMSEMFCFMDGIERINVSSFNTSKVKSMFRMFYRMWGVTELDLSHFDTSNVTDMSWMFHEMRNLKKLDLSNFNTSKVTNMGYMFGNSNSLESLNLSSFDTSNVSNMSHMFENDSSLTSLDVSSFNTSNVTDMTRMFSGLLNITRLDVSNFDTSNVTNMENMFNAMNNLKSIDVSNFNTSKVTSMEGMFNSLSRITTLDVSNFDTSNVTKMGWMFYGLSNVTELDISNFDTTKVTQMVKMFYKDNKLERIYVGNKWSTSNLLSNESTVDDECGSRNMFFENFQIVGQAGTTYDENHIDKEYARVDNPTNGNPGYFTLKTS